MSINNFSDDQAPGVVKATSRISSRGQIVIPIEIRKKLGIGEGDHLTFIAEKNGEVKVEAVKSQRITELFGILKTHKSFKPVDEIRKEAYEKMAQQELQDGEEG
ncbi:AbrB/MazE/SpoVT family DNA-binding domain-containing protein [Desulfosporosinus youngiae]|uniref:Looped-hinge helix DNA binding domain, AbrB family n=1 Tax=Desulfosporosinus youngiae DSM 17734 TaxID=768710 RepID=H5XYT2_9FIRM|nr:AbrB/MazE/SpoVT family DNA-binding domain-containing protein [Desulfosporosinus youngiae]EHQ91638.1 looped-hinge helix DNA binding domain, AbrB family [Desulfosporosinus youngiae DSM 17734]